MNVPSCLSTDSTLPVHICATCSLESSSSLCRVARLSSISETGIYKTLFVLSSSCTKHCSFPGIFVMITLPLRNVFCSSGVKSSKSAISLLGAISISTPSALLSNFKRAWIVLLTPSPKSTRIGKIGVQFPLNSLFITTSGRSSTISCENPILSNFL